MSPTLSVKGDWSAQWSSGGLGKWNPGRLQKSFFQSAVIAIAAFACFCLPTKSPAQPPAVSTGTSTNEQLAALQLELTNAWNSVLRIVNQPVQAYARPRNAQVGEYPFWFHEGAMRPDFDTVDVRQTQDLQYAKHQYVTSDLNPGMIFLGRDLEFNSMTKYFYTNRSLPKHKLSEAEMLEINRLYRVIGQCLHKINRITQPMETAAINIPDDDAAPAAGSNNVLNRIRAVPKEKRLLYGGAAIGGLIVIVLLLRLVRTKTG